MIFAYRVHAADQSKKASPESAGYGRIDLPLLLLFSLQFIFILFVAKNTVDWPHADDYVFIEWFRQSESGKRLWEFWIDAHVASHPLGTQAIISVLFFRYFGVHFEYIIYISIFAIIFSQLIIFTLFRGCSDIWRCGAVIVLCIAFFHPIQSSHIFWAFELGWFLVNFFVIINLFLVEKDIKGGWVFAILGCLLASSSSAQGLFSWVALGLHVAIKPSVHRRGIMIAASAIGFILTLGYINYLSEHYDSARTHNSLGIYIPYLIRLFGSVFATRSEITSLQLGSGVIFVLFIIIVQTVKLKVATSRVRAGATLIIFSILCLAAFAVGRASFGFGWVASHFHMGPLLVPLVLGMGILCLEIWFQPALSMRSKVPSLAFLFFIFSSIVPALRFGESEIRDGAEERMLAKSTFCGGRFPEWVVASVNLSIENIDLYRRSAPFVAPLCDGDKDPRTERILEMPALFQKMVASNPAASSALYDLWIAYIIHGDLRRAFPLEDPLYADKLLAFAISNAASGSHYDPKLLRPHAAYFIGLKQ